jgi:RND family efflux transporter MFP subunit
LWQRLKPIPTVQIAPARVIAEDRVFMAEGTVKGDRYEVGTSTGARIEWLGVKEGESVVVGQALFRLDSSDLALAVVQARAAIATADEDIIRARSVTHAKSISAQQRIRIAESAMRAALAVREQALQGPTTEHVERSKSAVEEARLSFEEAERDAVRSERLAEAGAVARAESRAKRSAADIARQRLEAAKAALAELEKGPSPEDRRAADAQVESARAEVEAANAGMVEVDAAEQDVAVARARRAEAMAAMRRAQASMQNLTVKSAAAGIVSRVTVQEGGVALPVTVVIATRKDLHIEAEVGTEYAPFLRPGFPIQVTSSQLGATPFSAKVEAIGPESEQKLDTTVRSRIVRVRLKIVDPAHRLLPGMDVDIQGTIKIPALLAVPNEALVQREGQSKVLLFEGGTVRWQNVRAGPIGLKFTPILDGIKDGDQVILSPGELSNGTVVRIAE